MIAVMSPSLRMRGLLSSSRHEFSSRKANQALTFFSMTNSQFRVLAVDALQRSDNQPINAALRSHQL
jgi:hypothetical protein